MECAPILSTLARPAALDQIEHTVADLWKRHTYVPDHIRIQLRIAITEVVANIVEHATKGLDRPVRLQMSAHVRTNQVQIQFTDDGIPNPVQLAEVTMPAELAERGRGIPLAKAVLSQLSYDRAEARNRWTLISHLF